MSNNCISRLTSSNRPFKPSIEKSSCVYICILTRNLLSSMMVFLLIAFSLAITKSIFFYRSRYTTWFTNVTSFRLYRLLSVNGSLNFKLISGCGMTKLRSSMFLLSSSTCMSSIIQSRSMSSSLAFLTIVLSVVNFSLFSRLPLSSFLLFRSISIESSFSLSSLDIWSTILASLIFICLLSPSIGLS